MQRRQQERAGKRDQPDFRDVPKGGTPDSEIPEHHKLYCIVRDAIFAAVWTDDLTRSEDDDQQRKAGKDVAYHRHFGVPTTSGATAVFVGYVDPAAPTPMPQGGTPHVTEKIQVLPLTPIWIEPIGVLIEYVLKGPCSSPTFVALVMKPQPPTPA
jgi:hypothetical protein